MKRVYTIIFLMMFFPLSYGKESVAKVLHELTPTRLYDGNVELIGKNSLVKQELGQWVKLLISRTEKFFGDDMEFDNHCIRLVINEKSESQKAYMTSSLFNGKVLQRFVLCDTENFDLQHMERLFAEMLLYGYVYESMERNEVLRSYKSTKIPEWLILGLSRNFYNSYRQADAESSYEHWINGRVLPLPEQFRVNLWSSEIAGVFLNRLRQESGFSSKFASMFKELVNGDVDYDWIRDDFVMLDDKQFELFWDDCLYIQKHLVYTRKSQMNEFEKYLFFQNLFSYKGYSGIPNKDFLPEAMSPIMVALCREQNWTYNYVDAKIRELSILAGGKSDEYRKLTAELCGYIQSIHEEELGNLIKNYRKIVMQLED